MPIDSALVEALLTPVPGDNPSGKDLRYDPRYDKVKEARREDLVLPEGGLATERKLADWAQVVTVGGQLLEKETKDLQLGAWLTEALLKRQGLGGLATGLSVLHGLVDRFWETLYPELDEDDLELRAGPLEWVGMRLDLPVRQVGVASGGITFLDHQESRSIPTQQQVDDDSDRRPARRDAESQGKRMPEDVDRAVAGTNKTFYKALVADADAAAAALAALETIADERFGRDAPSFSKLRNALDEVRRFAAGLLAQKLELDPDPVAETPLDAEDVGAYEPPAGWSAEGAAAGDGTVAATPANPNDAAARVGAAARFLRQQDAASPAPYLLLRGLRWGELRATPGEVDPRLLEAPPTPVRARLKALLLDGKWSELLEQGEQLMATPQGRGWLDLQRYAITACAQLGGPYDAVGAALRDALRSLLAALPQLPTMTMMDDTPTANDETRAWLDAEGLTGDAADAVDEPADDDGSSSLDDALAEEDETGENGGLGQVATRRRRRATPAGGAVGPRDPFAIARAEAAAGRAKGAIELLVRELSRERSPRGRFVRETQIAYLMVEAGLDAVALPILEKLVGIVDDRKLDEWEAGPLVAQPMALLCRVLDRLDEDESTRRELYLRICRLDPLQAIGLQRG